MLLLALFTVPFIVLLVLFRNLHGIMDWLLDPYFRWSMAVSYAIFTCAYHLLFWNLYDDGLYSGIFAFPPIIAGMPGSFIGMACSTLFSKLATSAVTGTLQWFCIGWAVDFFIVRARKRGDKRPANGPLSW